MTDPTVDGEDDASTPLTPEERASLIPSYVTLRSELNEIEQIGIDKATEWASRRRRGDVLDEAFLRQLHKRMFGNVWTWAGAYSNETKRRIGVDAWEIGPRLQQLLGDVRAQIEHASYAPDEIAVRFHHRLVWIHPFPNGNGRHARLATDLLIVQLGGARFTWGSGDLVAIADVRKRYVAALQTADREVFEPLIAFARS